MMKLFKPLLFAAGLLVLASPARAMEPVYREPPAGAVVCAPGVRGDCLLLGPAAVRLEMEALGIRLPFEPLPARAPDPNLSYLPYLYGQVVTPRAPQYATAEDASRAKNPIRHMEGEFLYISYEHTEVLNDMRVYMITPGVWMNAVDVHRIGTPYFQGLEFTRTPRNPFGWALTPVETRRSPGYLPSDLTGKWINRLEVMQVYGFRTVDEVEWVMIRPGEWIEKRNIGLVRPRLSAPPGVDASRWLDVNLYEQTIAVYENNLLVFATVISSGIEPFWTRPGLFQITQKLDNTPMSGSFEADRSDYYYLEDVPWTMYFDEARALHGAYWHTGYGYPRSHGCVNLSPGDAQWLYRWAQVGDWVYVHDPSGQTPTDPALYGSGGA
jgi:hypothetical protein